jgi:hypothetical protein
MRLNRLAGQGPRAAIASGVAAVLVLLVAIFGPSVSGVAGTLVGLLLILSLTVLLGGLAVAGLDLDWMEHPDTHSGRLMASLLFATFGSLTPLLLALAAVGRAPAWLMQLILCLSGLTAGGFTILHNLEGRRAGLIGGALPWVGISAGVLFLVFWLGVLLASIPLIAVGLFPGLILYAGWAIWIGVLLGRKPVPAAALT